VGGCALDDPQARWMRADLRRQQARCTLAYWHRPPFSSGRYGDPADTERVRALWRVAVEEGVDVVLAGHEHSYERHAPMDANGTRDADGTRLFVAEHRGAQRRHVGGPAARVAPRRLRLAVPAGPRAHVQRPRIGNMQLSRTRESLAPD
jgi:3',5'-cyclic AMP phosphodiesterase CpdA